MQTAFILMHKETGVIFVGATNEALEAYLKGQDIDLELERDHGFYTVEITIATSVNPKDYTNF